MLEFNLRRNSTDSNAHQTYGKTTAMIPLFQARSKGARLRCIAIATQASLTPRGFSRWAVEQLANVRFNHTIPNVAIQALPTFVKDEGWTDRYRMGLD